MIDTIKKFNIFDTFGNCYKVDKRNDLVVARDIYDASTFTFWEASQRVGSGRRSHFYKILEADTALLPSIPVTPEPEKPIDKPDLEAFTNPTKYDGLHNNWESMLSDLCYMSEHMNEYQGNLKRMLSEVDKEICDIMHYLEFTDLSDSEMLKVSRMLQKCRWRRREIKDEMEKTAFMCSSFLNKTFGNKVRQSLTAMEKLNERQYTPRKLNELFDRQ